MANKEEFFSIIEQLRLMPHPEGGYFKEIYRSKEFIGKESLPIRFESARTLSTSIYYMLTENDISLFHKIQSDEIWHFYKGTTIIIHQISSDGIYTEFKLGSNLGAGELPQIIIKNNNWFAAEVKDKNSFGLVGCTVSPGFDFKDFELAERYTLIEKFPEHEKLIKKFTKEF